MIKYKQILEGIIITSGSISLAESKEYQNKLVKHSLCSMMLTKIILKPNRIVQVLSGGRGLKMGKDMPRKCKAKSNPAGPYQFQSRIQD